LDSILIKEKASPKAGPWRSRKAQGFVVVTPGLAGVISAEGVRTLGGLVALAAGECAPEASSGFCSGGA
jgi:hypothetical protein